MGFTRAKKNYKAKIMIFTIYPHFAFDCDLICVLRSSENKTTKKSKI